MQKLNGFDPLWSKFQVFMKNTYSGLSTVRKNSLGWLCGPLDTILAFLAQFWPKLRDFDPLKSKFQIFKTNSYSGPQTMWKSVFVWLSRPLNTVLALWANFGPLRAKISKRNQEPPTF